MTVNLLKKLGIKVGARTFFADAPADALAAIDSEQLDVVEKLTGDFDYIHLFTQSRTGMDEQFPRLKQHLGPTGALWVSWPKNGGLGTDLKLPGVIEIGYNHGLVESKTISLNQTWSAIKFTHPRKGKVYNNSYGKLKT